MAAEIPEYIEILYRAMVPGPNPNFWPEHLKDDPALAHSMWTFYFGLEMGLKLGSVCFARD